MRAFSSGRNVIIGLIEAQYYQRFADCQQEVLIPNQVIQNIIQTHELLPIFFSIAVLSFLGILLRLKRHFPLILIFFGSGAEYRSVFHQIIAYSENPLIERTFSSLF